MRITWWTRFDSLRPPLIWILNDLAFEDWAIWVLHGCINCSDDCRLRTQCLWRGQSWWEEIIDQGHWCPLSWQSVAHRILSCTVPCILECLCFVRLPQLRHIVRQGVIRVGSRKKSLERENTWWGWVKIFFTRNEQEQGGAEWSTRCRNLVGLSENIYYKNKVVLSEILIAGTWRGWVKITKQGAVRTEWK